MDYDSVKYKMLFPEFCGMREICMQHTRYRWSEWRECILQCKDGLDGFFNHPVYFQLVLYANGY